MYTIVLTGPESTGKTTLAKALTQALPNALYVEEYARTFIDQLSRPYRFEDLLAIALQQMEMEEEQRAKNPDFLICDTAFLVLKIWSLYKYEICHPVIEIFADEKPYDLFILCGTDVPWEADPQRENPNEREELYAFYKKELEQHGKNFVELSGDLDTRIEKAIRMIKGLAER